MIARIFKIAVGVAVFLAASLAAQAQLGYRDDLSDYRIPRGASNYAMQINGLISRAEQGDIRSAKLVAEVFESGTMVRRNLEAAAHFYKVGADLGDADCMRKLAGMYDRGDGVEQDSAMAAQLRQQADGIAPTTFTAPPLKVVSVYVPGFNKTITAPVGIPLVARWRQEQHRVLEIQQQGVRLVRSGRVFDSGTYEFDAPAFLPLNNVSDTMLEQDRGKNLAALQPLRGNENWPAYFNRKILIWGFDGFAIASGGGAVKNILSYFATRPKTDYIYIEFFVGQQTPDGGLGLKYRDAGAFYSEAMIVPLDQLQGTSELDVAGALDVSSPSFDAKFAAFNRMLIGAIATRVVGGMVADMSRPLADQIGDSIRECERWRAIRGTGAIC